MSLWAPSYSYIFSLSSSSPPPIHKYSVFVLLMRIPLSSRVLYLFSLSSISALLSKQITTSSANIIVHGAFFLSSSYRQSITTSNRKGLSTEPWCTPTVTSNLSATAFTRFIALCAHTFLLSTWAKLRIAFDPDSHNTNTTSPHTTKIQSYLNISIKPITTYLCSEFLCFNSLQRIPKILVKLISCAKNMNYCGLTNYTLTHQSVSTSSLISNLQTYHSYSNTAIQHLNF